MGRKAGTDRLNPPVTYGGAHAIRSYSGQLQGIV
jgi:hypothetical protein